MIPARLRGLLPSTMHPTPFILHPATFTLRPTPFTLHPAHYTLFDSCMHLLDARYRDSWGELVFKAHRLVFQSTLGSKVMKKKMMMNKQTAHAHWRDACAVVRFVFSSSSSSVLLSSLQLSDTHVYEPQMRAILGTASHFRTGLFMISRRRRFRLQLCTIPPKQIGHATHRCV